MRHSNPMSAQAKAFLRDARILRRDAAEALRRGRCRYASPLEAAERIGRAAGLCWATLEAGLQGEIAGEWRRIRNLMRAYERTCVGRRRMA